jgi:ABC-2 type transport system permease protein
MSTLSYAASDATTMLRRNLKHVVRYPSIPVFVAGTPIIFLLLFVYVLGGTLGSGLGGGRDDYLAYIVPGVLMLTLTGSATGTAISVSTDMTEGIVARFRTMAISRGAVLTGHVLGSLIQTMAAMVLVAAVSLLIGFRPTGSPAGWLGALGVLTLIAFSVTWLSVAMGINAKSVETASNQPMILLLMPFLGSGFVPTESMPDALRWFADVQPFTPFIEAVRGLLMGIPVEAGTMLATLIWCAVFSVGGYVWALWLYNRKSVRA